jgi:hypothetical protein
MVGPSRDSFALLSAKDVMLFHHCQQAIQMVCMGYRQEALCSKPWCQVICLCVHDRVNDKLKSAEILDSCHSQQCKSFNADFVGSETEKGM